MPRTRSPLRERVFTPLVTLRLFLIQILHGNTAITHLRQLSGMDFATSSYDEARARLPLQVLLGLLHFLVQTAQKAEMLVSPRLLGQRIFLVDGSSFSMSDTPELRQHFGLPAGQKLGVGYPTAKLMGLLDAATGLFCQMLALPLFVHDLRAGSACTPVCAPATSCWGTGRSVPLPTSACFRRRESLAASACTSGARPIAWAACAGANPTNAPHG